MPFDILDLKQVALLMFFLFFLGVLAWTFASRRSRSFDHDAGLPLDEGRLVGNQSAADAEESRNVR